MNLSRTCHFGDSLWLILLSFVLTSFGVRAIAWELKIEPSNSFTEPFRQNINAKIPEKLKNSIPGTVLVRFIDMNSPGKKMAITDDSVCPSWPQTQNQSLETLRLGYYDSPSLFQRQSQKKYVVNVNYDFLPIIQNGPAAAVKISCGHGDLYQLSLATVLHEITHIYDDLALPIEPDEAQIKSDCATDQDSAPVTDWDCTYFRKMQHTLSDRPEWVFSSSRNNNLLGQRSPDTYEFYNHAESLAVNMEYFLLDSSYACRRPVAYDFLSRHFGAKPFAAINCAVNTQIRLSRDFSLADLDPSRIYQIHYLLAERGQDFSSRFGHSMLRLVICAPERKEVGPDCLKDVAYHVVVSFRANVEGIGVNNWDGLIGKYPSQLFLLSFLDVLQEYNVGEFRNLSSWPLLISSEEKQRVTNLVLEMAWAYQGRYYFVTNNCATELHHLLQASLDNLDFKHSMEINMPYGLLSLLKQTNLIDTSVQDKPEYFFPSFSQQVDASFNFIRGLAKFPQTQSADAFIRQTSASQRKQIYQTVRPSDASLRKKTAAEFLLLELRIKDHVETEIDNEIGNILTNADKIRHSDGDHSNGASNSQDQKLLSVIENLDAFSKKMQYWNQALAGYGIPLTSELVTGIDFEAELNQLKALQKQVGVLSQGLTQDLIIETNEILQNIEYFLSETK